MLVEVSAYTHPVLYQALRMIDVDSDLIGVPDVYRLDVPDDVCPRCVDSFLGRLSGFELETFCIGDHLDMMRLAERPGGRQANEFLNRFFDREFECPPTPSDPDPAV